MITAMTGNADTELVLGALRALCEVSSLELEAVARALGRVARPSISGPLSRSWNLEGPTRPFARVSFEIRGHNDEFVAAILELAPEADVLAADVEPLLAELPFAQLISHASFPTGPRITGFDYAFAVPAGQLTLQFRDPPDVAEQFGRASLERRITETMEGSPGSRGRLRTIVLGPPRVRFDPAFTLARMRRWTRDGGPWKERSGTPT